MKIGESIIFSLKFERSRVYTFVFHQTLTREYLNPKTFLDQVVRVKRLLS